MRLLTHSTGKEITQKLFILTSFRKVIQNEEAGKEQIVLYLLIRSYLLPYNIWPGVPGSHPVGTGAGWWQYRFCTTKIQFLRVLIDGTLLGYIFPIISPNSLIKVNNSCQKLIHKIILIILQPNIRKGGIGISSKS